MTQARACAACGAEITTAAICGDCEDATLEILDEFAGLTADHRGDLHPSLFAELDATASKQAVMGKNAGKTKGAEIPLPYAADRNGAPRASIVAADIARNLARHADHYGAGDIPKSRLEAQQELDGLYAGPRSRRKERAHDIAALDRLIADYGRELRMLGRGPEGVAEWLLGRMDIIRLSAASADMLRELRRHRARALAAIDRPAEPVYLADCHALHDGVPCNTALRGSARDETVTCWKCKAEHRVEDLLAARDMAIDEGLATVREIADAGFRLPWTGRRINEAMIKGYERRGRIVSHGMRQGLKLFRVGEVKAVAIDADRPRSA